MSGATFLAVCVAIGFAALIVAFLLVCVRIAIGPTSADRILGLDMLVTVGIGFIAAFAVRTGFFLYVDIAIALGLVGFLSTVALARLVATRGDVEIMTEPEEELDVSEPEEHWRG